MDGIIVINKPKYWNNITFREDRGDYWTREITEKFNEFSDYRCKLWDIEQIIIGLKLNSINKDIIRIKKNYEKFNLIPKEENSSDEENEHSDGEDNPNTVSNPNESSRIEIINNFDNNIFNPNISSKKEKISQKNKYEFEVTRCNTCFVLRPISITNPTWA